MAKAQDVAKFFIHLAQKQEEAQIGDLATNMRIQKLLYFAQGWHLARHGKPLFCAPLSAWKFGPVVPDVYFAYNTKGGQGLVSDPPPQNAFTQDEYDLLLDVAREYDSFSTSALVSMSHQADAPWSKTAQSQEISVQSISDYFKKLPPLPSFDSILEGYPVEEL